MSKTNKLKNKDFYVNKIKNYIYNKYKEECTEAIECTVSDILDYSLSKHPTKEECDAYEKALDCLFAHEVWTACYEVFEKYIDNASLEVLTKFYSLVNIDFPIIDFVYDYIPEDYEFIDSEDSKFNEFVEKALNDLLENTDSYEFNMLFKDVISIDTFNVVKMNRAFAKMYNVYLETHNLFYISSVQIDENTTNLNISNLLTKYVSFNAEKATLKFNNCSKSKHGYPKYNALLFGINSIDDSMIEPIAITRFDTGLTYKINNEYIK